MWELITTTRPREVEYPMRHVQIPYPEDPPSTPERDDMDAWMAWRMRNEWVGNFTVHKDLKPEAMELAKAAWDAKQKGDLLELGALIARLRSMQAKEYDDKEPVEKWGHMAVQLVDYTGPGRRAAIRDMFADRFEGSILEVMCGHHTYHRSSQSRSIVELDWCRESLELHEHPERPRILLDLNTVKNGGMSFLESGSPVVCSVCSGDGG